MSYKHNNLMAMRVRYWEDSETDTVKIEKQFLKQMLIEHGVFQAPTLEDVKYFFFSLPSIIIVKGYALGFTNGDIKNMISQYIQENKNSLMQHETLKIQYRMS
ncbi:hypothetical protein [Acinetobacter piscicola]|uniref:hypothetical protein n=1 Tax=Acinetobacter piscicola TaxID=2006115 RepID=UPI00101F22FA|nr:hypothetical protein [Acinetobacter piscicola]RYL26629.1 hypothetical protein EWP19_08475 [Acinetobacter piscicola]